MRSLPEDECDNPTTKLCVSPKRLQPHHLGSCYGNDRRTNILFLVQVEEEAADIWCADSANIKPLVKCFVSVGTGHSDVRSVADRSLKHLVETLQKVATETEDTNQQFESRWREYMMSGRCFRFNVGNGLEGIKLAEYEERKS
jgi:hypothetical protein